MSESPLPQFRSVLPRGWRSQGLDGGLALATMGVELVLLLNDGEASVGAVLLTGVGGGVLVLRRQVPLLVLAVTLTSAAAIVILGDVPAGVTVFVALYSTAAICERKISLLALLPTAIVITVLSVAAAEAGDQPSSVVVGSAAAAPLTVGVWALGAYTQTRRRYTRALEDRAAQLEREREQLAQIAVQQERTAIARELHDIVAHSVSVMLLGVRGARDVLHSSPSVAHDVLGRVEASGEQSLHELRRILSVLRSPELGAESRPQPSLVDLDELVSVHQAAGLAVQLQILGEQRSLPGSVELSVYRIVQEALTNVIKHAHATRVSVCLTFHATSLDLEITNNGHAPAPRVAHLAGYPGQGIIGMRERVAVLGGDLETGSPAGGGFRVRARLPFEVES